MLEHITNYNQKKLVEYLEDGMKVLLLFGHGLGDTIMFMPLYEALKKEFTQIEWHLHLECGQDLLFESSPWQGYEDDYDLIFSLNYPMCEWTEHTKNAMCCIEELGVDPSIVKNDFATMNKYPSPLVGLHFQGTALPNSVNCPEETAKEIWNDVIECGLIPIECHFQHVFHNPVNTKYNFIDSTIRNSQPSLPPLVGLIQRCTAFIGAASGPLVVALANLGCERVCYLQNQHRIESYTKEDVFTINVKEPYIKGTLRPWLNKLKGECNE